MMNIEYIGRNGVNLIPVESRLCTNKILFLDKINKESVSDLVKTLLYLLEIDDPYNAPISLFICASDGNMQLAYVVIDYIQSYSDRICLIGQGKLSFAATMILISGGKGNRYALPSTSLCVYDVKAFDKPVTIGFESHVSEHDKIKKIFDKSSDGKCDFHKLKKERIGVNEAYSNGLIDNVLNSVGDLFKTKDKSYHTYMEDR